MKRTVSASENDNLIECYKIHSSRTFSGIILVSLLIISALISLTTGSYNITVSNLFELFTSGSGDPVISHVVYNIRFPRMLIAIVAGASLGVAGLIMQSVLENPLASPFTTGISQGAMFGATFAIIFLGAASANVTGTEVYISSLPIVAICAFAGSLITVFMIAMLSSVINIKSESIILAGIAISSFFSALTMLLQHFASDVDVAASVIWTFGDLSRAGYNEVLINLAVLVPAVIFFYINSWGYTCLLWGDEVARGLGIKTVYFRMFSLVIASVIVAVPVSFVGIIGFVGLMAPHMVKLFISGDNRYLIPYSALSGAVLLLCADVLSKLVVNETELPVGIMTSIAGVPFFLYLLLKKHGRRG